jgi:hypothetical protein
MMKRWSFIQNSSSVLFANVIGFHCTWVVKASVSGFPSQVDKFEQNSVSGHKENGLGLFRYRLGLITFRHVLSKREER